MKIFLVEAVKRYTVIVTLPGSGNEALDRHDAKERVEEMIRDGRVTTGIMVTSKITEVGDPVPLDRKPSV